jgi:molybdopterin molybdotransferase
MVDREPEKAMRVVAADEARARLAALATRALRPEMVALAEAAGRVLAEDIVAAEPLPPWPRSAMDGFAVRADDTRAASAAAPAALHVVGEVPVGGTYPGPELGAGEAIAIATGGVVPPGADAVVMVEDTATQACGSLHIRRAAARGQHVIQVGEDIASGTRLLAAGHLLRPADLAALAAFGRVTVDVFRRPRVAILATGSEVIAPHETPRPGQVRDMNQIALAAAVARAGALPLPAGLVGDDPAALAAAILRATSAADVLLIAGGSSVGVRDFTAAVLASLGARVEFHGVHLRPGRPTLLATLGEVAILGLPGVPASALIVFTALVAPFLRRLAGEHPAPPAPRLRGQLAPGVTLASALGREDYVRVALGADGLVTPLRGGNMAVGTLVRADGLVCIPADVESVAAGSFVEILPT